MAALIPVRTDNFTWERFEVCNEELDRAFQNLTEKLFNICFFNGEAILHSNPNNTGVEVEPILQTSGTNRNKWVSFQSKYFKGKIQYSKIEDSLKKAAEEYAGRLDLIYLYCNKPVSTKSKTYVRINELLKQYGIDIELITDNNLLNSIMGRENEFGFYFGINNEFQVLIDNIEEKTKSTNLFHYLNPDIKFRGRKEEYEALKRFMDSRTSFLYWAITGPGGMGKSKLVNELMNDYSRNKNWKTVYLPSNTLEQLLAMKSYRYDRDLLVVIDYAGVKTQRIKEWIQKILPNALGENNKLRILLLERLGFKLVTNPYTGVKENMAPEWFKDLTTPVSEGVISDRSEILRSLYTDVSFPGLLVLGNLDNSDYYKMIDDLVKGMKKDLPEESIEVLDDATKKEVIEYVKERNHNSDELRPLYVLLTAYAAAKGDDYNNWGSNDKILKSVYDRDFESWRKSFPETDLRNAILNLLVYTTSVKEWIYGDVLPDFLKQYERIIADHRRRSTYDPISDWNTLLTGQSSYNKKTLLSPLEPDIIGEYYVLRTLEKEFHIDYTRKTEWCSAFCVEIEQCIEFIERCITDFGNSSEFQVLIDILETMISVLSEKSKIEMDALETERKRYFVLTAYLHLWEQANDEYKKTAYDYLKSTLMSLKDTSLKAAEVYVELLYYRQNIRGRRRERLNKELEPLYKKWSKSALITKAYIENLGELGKNSFSTKHNEFGENAGSLIAEVLQNQNGDNRSNEIAETCVIALGKILTAAYQETGTGEAYKQELLDKLLSNSIDNSESVISNIQTCANIITAKYERHNGNEWKSTLFLLLSIIETHRERSFFYDWRLGDVLKDLIKLLCDDNQTEMLLLIDWVCKLAEESLSFDSSERIRGGASWHWRITIEKILEMGIDNKNVNNQLYSTRRKLLKKV